MDDFGWTKGILTSVQHPERFVSGLSPLCRLPISRRCSRQVADCLRPAGIPVLLGRETAQYLRPAGISVPLDGAGALSASYLRPARIPVLLGVAGA